MKKDHIALPHSTLKRFREPGEENFFYIDLANNRIDKKGPSVYQKQNGYYQKEFDDICQRIETLMGVIHTEIDKLYKSKGGSFYTNDYLLSIAIDIITLQTVRRPESFETVTKPDVVINKLNEGVAAHAAAGNLTPKLVDTANMYREILTTTKKRRNFFYERSFEEMKKIQEGLLQSCSATILAIHENVTATYLLTPYHFFIYDDCFVITLSPRYAIVLMPNDKYTALNFREDMAILITDESDVLSLIPSAIEATSPCAKKHLIGERYMLNRVREHLQNNPE